MPDGHLDPGGSRVPKWLSPICAAALALVVCVSVPVSVAGDGPATIAGDFDAALGRIRTPVAASRDSIYLGRIGLDAYVPEADALAKTHGPAAVGFLRPKINGPDRDASLLALTTLAVLAHEPEAADELVRALRDSISRHEGIVMALTYAPAPVALRLADEALQRSDTRAWDLGVASTLYRLFGDPRRASALAAELARRPRLDPRLRADARADLAALRQRLLRPAAERPAWSVQDRIVWRALRSMPGSRGLDMALHHQAAAACASTQFTADYLKTRLRASSIDPLELRLVLLIAGRQREAAVIPELAAMVDARRGPWGDAMHALLAIGTRDALAPVEHLIAPPPVPTGRAAMSPGRRYAEQARSLLLTLCQELAQNGDRVTLDLMKARATDTAYTPAERAAFVKARDVLRVRLGAGL